MNKIITLGKKAKKIESSCKYSARAVSNDDNVVITESDRITTITPQEAIIYRRGFVEGLRLSMQLFPLVVGDCLRKAEGRAQLNCTTYMVEHNVLKPPVLTKPAEDEYINLNQQILMEAKNDN